MLIPRNTSNPHVQGACIVTNVIRDLTMFDEWRFNMKTMVSRIKTICQRLYDEISTGQKWQGLVIYLKVNWHVLFHWIEQGSSNLVLIVAS